MSTSPLVRGVPRLGIPALVLVALAAPAAAAAEAPERYTLEEPASDTRVFVVEARLEAEGHLETPIGDGQSTTWKLAADADFQYRERRLSGAGRDAQALRSLRQYAEARLSAQVDDQSNYFELSESRRAIVAFGRRQGVSVYSPDGPLSADELELLAGAAGDSLAMLALLPRTPLAVGERWTPESWVLPMLTRMEAVLKSELACELQAVRNGMARVVFQGKLEGATDGAAAELEVAGHYLYNLRDKYIMRFELTEKRQQSPGVKPGVDATATMRVRRVPAGGAGPLTDAAAEAVPLEPDPGLLDLLLELPWNARLRHDRNWHVFTRADHVTILRLLDKGSFIAQCNVTPVPSAAPGRHTSEADFQRDIRESLGDRLRTLAGAEQIKTDDGRFLYRVTAVGQVRPPSGEPIPMHWIYYLCASPSGRQLGFVFAVESDYLERLGNRDLGIVNSLEFRTPRPPRKAER